ncbi:MAG: DUF1508 domain-containing protein [Mycobacterium sp.]|uniref:DUF1508 domain-containing protein n=1 Tax=Mycobacterium sp. TaxID=1785 RepID=UPI003F9DAA1C
MARAKTPHYLSASRGRRRGRYETKANAEKGIESVKTNALKEAVVDLTEEPAHK